MIHCSESKTILVIVIFFAFFTHLKKQRNPLISVIK